MSNIDESRQRVEDFIANVEARQVQQELNAEYKRSRQYKYGCVEEARKRGLENCAAGVISKIYTDALPMDKSYKGTHQDELDGYFLGFIKKKNPNGAYAYLTDCAHHGSKPAKMIIESVDSCIDKLCRTFYEEIDETEAEDINLEKNDKSIIRGIEDITTNMDSEAISTAIENNVEATIQREIQNTREEDERLQNLQERLKSDNEVNTESALEAAMTREGFAPNTEYKPSLFSGIMIHKSNLFEESGLDDEAIQKKAFSESVKEYTALELLHTMNFEKMKAADVDRLAQKYAYGMI